jgi:hypothetical protein
MNPEFMREATGRRFVISLRDWQGALGGAGASRRAAPGGQDQSVCAKAPVAVPPGHRRMAGSPAAGSNPAIRLIGQVITVSLETLKIVGGLPAIRLLANQPPPRRGNDSRRLEFINACISSSRAYLLRSGDKIPLLRITLYEHV